MKSTHRFPNITLRWRFLLAAASGVLYFVAFVGFDQWYLAWVCLVPLLFALEGVSAKDGFFIGWLFGTVALVGGFSWVAYTIHVFAFMPWIVSGIGCLLLNIAQATEFAVFGLIYALLRRRTSMSPLIIATAAFVAAEFCCPQLFPHYFGNSQYRQIAVIQISDITGVLGVTGLLVLANAALFEIIRGLQQQRRLAWRPALWAGGAVILALAYGFLRIPIIKNWMESSPKVRFGIAQANLGIYEKKRNPKKALRLNEEMTVTLAEMGAQIVVWPETAVQAPVLSANARKLPEVVFGDLKTPVFTGVIQQDPADIGDPMYNAAVLTDAEGNISGQYRKQKLLMLGEYIPLGESFPWLYDAFPYISRFTPGDSNEPIAFGDYSFSVNICYEEILPRLIRRMMAREPNAIVNITNDNWFGRTHEPLQHLVLAAFRSVEHRRWLVRSTNTGISAFVDATGRIVERTPLMEQATLIADVPMMTGSTLYARFGDWLGWMCVAVTTLLLLAGRRKKRV